MIAIDDHSFNIYVNDHFFLPFAHRLPFNTSGLVTYTGDAGISFIDATFPAPAASAPPSSPPPPVDTRNAIYEVKNAKLPFLQPIKGACEPGTWFLIGAKMIDNRFDISLYQGPDPYENSRTNVAFHMEVYLNEKQIVRNSYQNGQWQREEREACLNGFPFFLNYDFNLILRVESNRYSIIVNDKHLFDFHHRVLPLSTVNHLHIHGGLQVTNVAIFKT